MLVVILPLLILLPTNFGQNIYLYSSPLPLPSLAKKNYLERVATTLTGASFAPFISSRRLHHFKHLSPSPALSPEPQGIVTNPHGSDSALSPSSSHGCSLTCANPFASIPYGSICMCVIPMRVRLLLGAQVYVIFERATELEIEVAAGTYLRQSQVQITGATSDEQSPERSVVDLNLVPLEEKFDNTTSSLIYQRLLNSKVVLNRTLFGDCDLSYLEYPGFFFSRHTGGPPQSGGNDQDPVSADIPKKQSKINTQIILLVAFSIIAFLVACLATAAVLLKFVKFDSSSDSVGHSFTYWYKRSESMLSGSQASSSVSIDSFVPPSFLTVKTFSLAELKVATENFSAKNVLGVGGFGCVYHGTMQDGDEVAVKLLTRNDENGGREFIAEIETLSRLHHRNLVKLIGICIDQRTRCLVYELVPNGSVESHLHGADQSKKGLHWDSRLKIALGAARGLAYLHEESNPRVIHRDFKASNILLEHDFTPKISDFGLAREATEGSSKHISTRVMGTFGYVAPEYAMTGHLLVKSDVYSYGVVLLELLSGRKPVDMSQPPGQENLVTWARPLLTDRDGLMQLVDLTMAGTYDFDELAKVAAIASMCVHPEVADRPFMGEVVQALKLICNDTDEMGEDASCQREYSPNTSDFQGNFTPTPTSRQASAFITMEYCSDPDIQVGKRRFPDLGGAAIPTMHGNLSDPQRMPSCGPTLSTVRSMSEHGKLLLRARDSDRYQGASF